MVIHIFGIITDIVIAAGIVTALMVWQKKTDYRAFYELGIVQSIS